MDNVSQSLRIFISFARADGAAFAQALCDALKGGGFDAYADGGDFEPDGDWKARIGARIAVADAFVFVHSPGSQASENCAWEVAQAKARALRIIPLALPEGAHAAALDGLIATLAVRA